MQTRSSGGQRRGQGSWHGRSPGRGRGAFHVSEVLVATLLIAVVVMPLLYFFTAADRQARFTEGFFLAHHRARFIASREAWRGREQGLKEGELEIDGPGIQPGLPAGSVLVEEVKDLPGLLEVRVAVPWGGAVIGHRQVEHARLVADPRVFVSGRPGKP